MENLEANIRCLLTSLAAAAARAGRDPGSVRLVAVSKTVDAAAVAAAHACGLRNFGENRVQELQTKAPLLPPDCQWHLIGHLQQNKARPAVEYAAWIHSVDSQPLLARLDRLAGELGRCPRILLQANISGEASKSGADPAAMPQLCEAALACRNLELRGLMTMAPFGLPEADTRRVFAGLRELRDRLAADFGAPLPELSMGMSGDYAAAIAEGATMVRIGTAIFGERHS